MTALTVPNGTGSGSSWIGTSLAVGTPLALIAAAGGVWYLRRRRGAQPGALPGRA